MTKTEKSLIEVVVASAFAITTVTLAAVLASSFAPKKKEEETEDEEMTPLSFAQELLHVEADLRQLSDYYRAKSEKPGITVRKMRKNSKKSDALSSAAYKVRDAQSVVSSIA